MQELSAAIESLASGISKLSDVLSTSSDSSWTGVATTLVSVVLGALIAGVIGRANNKRILQIQTSLQDKRTVVESLTRIGRLATELMKRLETLNLMDGLKEELKPYFLQTVSSNREFALELLSTIQQYSFVFPSGASERAQYHLSQFITTMNSGESLAHAYSVAVRDGSSDANHYAKMMLNWEYSFTAPDETTEPIMGNLRRSLSELAAHGADVLRDNLSIEIGGSHSTNKTVNRTEDETGT